MVIIGSTGLIGKTIAGPLTDKGHETVQVSRTTQPGVNLGDLTSINSFYKALGEGDDIICVAGRCAACTATNGTGVEPTNGWLLIQWETY